MSSGSYTCDIAVVPATDLLAVQMLPEWPAATLVLRRFVKVLYSDKGLHHPDAAVKLAAVDFTGQLASRLCAEAAQAEQEADQVQAVLEEALRADVAGEQCWLSFSCRCLQLSFGNSLCKKMHEMLLY